MTLLKQNSLRRSLHVECFEKHPATREHPEEDLHGARTGKSPNTSGVHFENAGSVPKHSVQESS